MGWVGKRGQNHIFESSTILHADALLHMKNDHIRTEAPMLKQTNPELKLSWGQPVGKTGK